ncbi:PilZ domain-containing protein [Ectothiorhodospira marina]|jgi:hypothetical protein|uniref:PilZ domain-containing protein n=2 Tax=Ectothiorhodospiraceae TaxID=72276 RepID=A0A1H7KWU2_9GAMM|nr:PilZ domain-containing protein [Ectothiorhodospira marina]
MNMGMDEKRDFQRLQVDHPVKVKEMDSGREHQGLGRDLSPNGLSFYLDDPLPLGAQLTVAIEPIKALVAPFNAEVEVLRVDPEGLGYVVATKIQRML